jgi:integrase
MLAEEKVGTEVTSGEYLSQWLRHCRGRLRSKTYEGYEGVIRLYAAPGIGPVPLSRLQPLHLQQLYSDLIERGLAGGTVLNLHLVLAQALAQAVRWGLIERSPAAGAQPPRPRRPEPVVVDSALAARIMQAVRGTPMELPAVVALATGMRRGEILALRWGDLDPGYTLAQVRRSLQVSGEGLHFVEPKTRRSRRSVALPAFLAPYLRRQKEDQEGRRAACSAWRDMDLVIDAGDGGPWHPDTLSSGWYSFLKRSGLPHVRFHDLRHAHATLLLLSRVHPKVVSERLGHASVGITLDLYSHVLPSMQSEAAAAIDDLFAAGG